MRYLNFTTTKEMDDYHFFPLTQKVDRVAKMSIFYKNDSDVVSKGDLLVSGVIENKNSTQFIHSEGIVIAETKGIEFEIYELEKEKEEKWY